MKTLVIDNHGVTFDVRRAKHEILQEETGLEIPAATFSCGEVYKSGTLFWDPAANAPRRISERAYQAAMGKFFEPQNYARLMKPLPGVVDGLTVLAEYYEAIYLVTQARGVDQDCLEGLVLQYDLPITEVYPTYGKPKDELYTIADDRIDDDYELLGRIAKTHGLESVLMIPSWDSVGGQAFTVPQDLHNQVRLARTWDEAIAHLTGVPVQEVA